jgi:hypothetical protein
MPREYTMSETVAVEPQAFEAIANWLITLPLTEQVKNVKDDLAYQKLDVDMVWQTTMGSYQVEIKGDRYYRTGNFFLETVSNKEKGTPGCFLYTQANLLFYYFIEPRVLYILPMPRTREWFLANRQRFQERSTRTSVRNNFYTTVGCLVPIHIVLREVPGVVKRELLVNGGCWNEPVEWLNQLLASL